MLQHPIASRVISWLVAEARRSAELSEAFFARYRDPRREAGEALLRRAVERGELPPDVDIELALDLLAGPLYLRAGVASGSQDRAYGERLADAFLRANAAMSIAALRGGRASARPLANRRYRLVANVVRRRRDSPSRTGPRFPVDAPTCPQPERPHSLRTNGGVRSHAALTCAIVPGGELCDKPRRTPATVVLSGSSLSPLRTMNERIPTDVPRTAGLNELQASAAAPDSSRRSAAMSDAALRRGRQRGPRPTAVEEERIQAADLGRKGQRDRCPSGFTEAAPPRRPCYRAVIGLVRRQRAGRSRPAIGPVMRSCVLMQGTVFSRPCRRTPRAAAPRDP